MGLVLSAAFEEADRRYGSFGRFLTYGLEASEVMLTELGCACSATQSRRNRCREVRG